MHVTDHDALAAALATTDPFAPAYDDLDPEALSVVGLVDAAVAASRVISHLMAFEARVFAVAERRIRAQDAGSSRGGGSTESELTASVHLPPATLRTRLALCGLLCERFPETLAKLSKGNVSWVQVKPLLDQTSCMGGEDARAVQAMVLPGMGEANPRTVYNRVQAAIHRVDPQGAAERHAQRARARCVAMRPQPDGMATITVFLKAEVAQAIQARVNAACARRAKGDTRTLDQRRVDTLAQMILSSGGQGAAVPAAMVHVVVNVESLIGLEETPAQLEGHGPITPAQARALVTAPGSQLRRLFVDGAGKLVRVEPRRYRLGAQLQRHLRARDRTCSFKGCTMPARRCDLDHMHAFGDGGCSCEENLHPACRTHHQEKTAGLWRVHREGDAIVWTSTTTGRRYVSIPEPYPVAGNQGPPDRPGFWPRS